MASGRDVRDMLGLPAGIEAPKTAIQKRPKPAAPARKIQGVAREVAALYGERPPPVAVYEEKKSYRAKRQSTGPAKKWVQRPFINQARHDGLLLKHWRRKPTSQPPLPNGDEIVMEENDGPDTPIEDSSEFVKYNVEVEMPTFTDEEYNLYLRSNDWTREETDYLLQTIKDYSFRWAVIWDRYNYQAPNHHLLPPDIHHDPSNALSALPFAHPNSKSRSVEDLKARYYSISAKLMKLRIPEVQMDADQYARYETLTKFDPHLERNRKTLAAALMNRNLDEVKEEEFLLAELQRINMAANRLDAERAELRSRLEAPASSNTASAAGLASFQSSQALAQLFQQLFQQDRHKKRASGGGTGVGPGRLSISAADMMTPTTAHGQLSASSARRQSSALGPPPTPIKTLSPQQEYRFNVSTHDRLTSGVSFGTDKLLKMRQAKSNVQTQKIAAALQQLGISEVIPLPTARVGEVFEALVGKVGRLLDVRKVREKEEGEVRILEGMKRKLGLSGDNDGDATMVDENGNAGETPAGDKDQSEIPDSQAGQSDDDDEGEDDDDADGEDADGDADPDADGDADGDDDEDAEGEEVESTRQNSEAVSVSVHSRAVSGSAHGHKRSASVLSQASRGSVKRHRK
ncbi:hypothetical protein P154DRAFT_488133 [Amniculicola lignicola CBS 123094]|uniref:SWR1-complex protein 4 n=1 Tax=Amniculicola lignicola CBS 123094 TaxID=1392246 RepID=A0A6A5WUC5_9PLEO|nr:hypothetical protein P154DRAFT_488133 [Amniculicola lignicola CBS 123094]